MRRVDPIGGLGILFLLGGFIAIMSRCSVVPAPVDPPKPAPVDAADPCVAACQNLARMHCDWAEPTPGEDETLGTADDGFCVDVCLAAETMNTSLNPSCVAEAESCAQAESCIQ